MLHLRNVLLFSIATVLLFAGTHTSAAPYDPLTPLPDQTHSEEITLHDNQRNRDIPLRIYLPATLSPAPLILFSHGLGGSREGNAYTGEYWSQRGYVVVAMQHAGSDEAIWQGKSVLQMMPDMKQAASGTNLVSRINDVHSVIDQLTQLNSANGNALYHRLDLQRIGMSGHSFGAVTTEAVSGQTFPAALHYTDPRIKAALAFSPSVPRQQTAEQAFSVVPIPWMLMTGTEDNSRLVGTTAASRLAVYPALPPGDKYELVLYRAEHSAFTDRPLMGDREQRNANHHRVILALSTAFWDAYLKNDAAAKAWLQGNGPRTVMQAQDRWQWK